MKSIQLKELWLPPTNYYLKEFSLFNPLTIKCSPYNLMYSAGEQATWRSEFGAH